jgi:hypothetical protein
MCVCVVTVLFSDTAAGPGTNAEDAVAGETGAAPHEYSEDELQKEMQKIHDEIAKLRVEHDEVSASCVCMHEHEWRRTC